MPPREDDIRNQIKRMEGQDFERFARELLSREKYPGLNPTSRTHDLGEDAKTEPSTLIRHGRKWISLAVSKEANLRKLKGDCDRCLETGRKIDIFVFVTAGNPRTDMIERWKEEIKKEYGWILEVYTLDFLAPYASRPQYESLVSDYLTIPPPGGDFLQDIEERFDRHTANNLVQKRITIPGTTEPLSRVEVRTIEEQLSQGRRIILTGEAGTGKSGIACMLVTRGRAAGKVTFLFDARRLSTIHSEGELRLMFDLKGPLYLAIERVAKYRPCRLILDQLDNIAGLDSANVLLELTSDLSKNVSELELIVICRNKELHEKQLLSHLLASGFVELICREISIEDVREVLNRIGLKQYGTEVISLGRNLLNLELMADIHVQQPDFDFSKITDEIYLWDEFIATWPQREGTTIGEEMYAEAVALARRGLNHPDGLCEIDIPQSQAVGRLVSGGIITQVDGRIFRFRHEKFQDFIYARDAADRMLMPGNILGEILDFRTPNVFSWVDAIYLHRGSPTRANFLKEMFNV